MTVTYSKLEDLREYLLEKYPKFWKVSMNKVDKAIMRLFGVSPYILKSTREALTKTGVMPMYHDGEFIINQALKDEYENKKLGVIQDDIESGRERSSERDQQRRENERRESETENRERETERGKPKVERRLTRR